MERQYFAFFESYFDAIEELPKKYQLMVYRAICLYGLKGEVDKNLSGVSKALFISLQPALEKNRKKCENALAKRNLSGEQQANAQRTMSERQANSQLTADGKGAEDDRTNQNNEYKGEKIKNKGPNNIFSSQSFISKQKGKNTMVLRDNSVTKYSNDKSW